MKKSPTPLGLNGIYLGPSVVSSSESKYQQKTANAASSFLPVSPSPSPPPPSSSPPPLHSKPPMVRMDRSHSPSPSSSQPISSRNQNGIASTKNYLPLHEEQSPPPQQPSSSPAPPDSHNKVLIPKVHKPIISEPLPATPVPVPTPAPDPTARPPKSPPSPTSPAPKPPEKTRPQKHGKPNESRKNQSPHRSKSPKHEKESQNGGLVGKTLRSQKMELRIRAARENGDGESSPSTTSSESGQSETETNPSSNQPSRAKIYEPDMSTYGISNGTLANRTKRILEKQAKIEGVGKNKNQDGSKGDNTPSSPSPEATEKEGDKKEKIVEETKVEQPSSSANNSHTGEANHNHPPNPYPYPYPPPYGYPPYPNSSSPMSMPPFGYPPNYPPGYPSHYPGYYPNYLGLIPHSSNSLHSLLNYLLLKFSGAPFPSMNPELLQSQPLNFDLPTLMLAKQLMALSEQLKGLNGPGFDPKEYYRIMALFQQLSSGFLDPNASHHQQQHQQQLNDAAENERRSKQEEMSRMLQEQIQSLQLQLQHQLEKNELAAKVGRETVEREELRLREEQQERLRREAAEAAEREEKRRLELAALEEERQQLERLRAQREQEEREERERLRLLREKEERELQQIRERVECEEREEMEHLREMRERIEREEREELERLKELREQEVKEAHDRKIQREFAELAKAERLKLKGTRSRSPMVGDDFQMTPEMTELADEHRRRTGKELPRVLYRLVPHRSKFRRANELFESNIHADQVSGDDESLHSVTSESIRSYLSKQESGRFSRSSSKASVAETIYSTQSYGSGLGSPSLQHQSSLPLSSSGAVTGVGAATGVGEAEPIVVACQSKFTCDNPLLHKTKDDFWIDPTSTIPEDSPPSSPKATAAAVSSRGRTSTLMGAYDNFKNYLRKKSIFSEEAPQSSESSPSSSLSSPPLSDSSYIPQPLPPMNLEKLSSAPQRRPKRGSKDDLEIERITSLMSLSAAHLRQVNLTAGAHHHRHPQQRQLQQQQPKKSE